jgi:hypothetical protein
MLAIIAAAGLLLCLTFLGLAVFIGGDDVLHDPRSLRAVKPLIDLATHKEWRWSGGDTLALDTPINIRYQPGGPPGVSVTGPAELLKHVRVGDGRIVSDAAAKRNHGAKLQAVVSGVKIRKFVVNGGENLELGQLDQPDLDLHINGSGTVSGHGRVQHLNLAISGPGNAELGGLAVGDADVSIFGSGNVTLSPHGNVQLFIAGSGGLKLLTRPANLRQTIIGSGKVSGWNKNARTDAPPNPPTPPSERIEPQVPSNVPAVFVRGYNAVDLGHVEQPTLNITTTSSASVTGEGKVDTLNVSILGDGQANLGKIAAREVNVAVMGSGDASVAPGDVLKVTISGSGNVHVLSRPTRIERVIHGSGRIIEAYQRH